jgi:hypothetical protein
VPHTLGWPAEKWHLFDVCHRKRNVAEYEGSVDVDNKLVGELIALTSELIEAVSRLRKLIPSG